MKEKKMMMLGPPGAGKGTQAKALAMMFKIPQVSTGDMLRAAKQNKTELGLKAAAFMDAGDLVPDEVVIGIVEERLKADDAVEGYILDGFPRTVVQAEAMEQKGIELSYVWNIQVPDEEVVRRLSGRRTCPTCGTLYHIEFNPTSEEGLCDKDGTELMQRDDDKPEVILNRLDVYKEKTQPLIDFYRQRNLLIDVEGGSKPPKEVFRVIVQQIEK